MADYVTPLATVRVSAIVGPRRVLDLYVMSVFMNIVTF